MSLQSEKIASVSSEALLGPNPFIGFGARDVSREIIRAAKLAGMQPALTMRAVTGLLKEFLAIRRGDSTLKPHPRDRRFADSAWQDDARYRAWLQSFLAFEKAVENWLDGQDLAPHSRARFEFMVSLILDALAPSNFPLQPLAVRKFKESGGHSALEGASNLLRDLRQNGGLPAQVDKTQFEVGKNLANTPGQIVLQTEVFELIQYQPQSAKVREVPVLFVPPQINKYYVFDLSPEKSVVKALLEAGLQVFMISWRNPGVEHAQWGLAEYGAAIDQAISAICDLTASARVNMAGACAGGITLAAYVAARCAARDQRIGSLTLVVSVLDTGTLGETPLGLFATDRAIREAKKKSAKKGVLDGKAMAAAFSWLRPNDLIWNYWVNNVLLGNKPPSFDLLYWNNDNTRLPARLHAEFLEIMQTRSIVQPGKLRMLGVPVDLGRITCDTYVLGGTTDHITPWKACYRNTQLFKGDRTFVLSNAGHMQSILNPPGNKKSEFWTGGTLGPDASQWREGAEHHKGSWWPHWHAWLHERSGNLKTAPDTVGSETYPPIQAAPGTYVLN